MQRLVTVDLADVRNDEGGLETQVMRGEPLFVEEAQGKRLKVTCPWQPYFNGREWQGYPGWVEVGESEMVDELPILATQPSREAIVGRAREWIGLPYVWGGLDCSSLVLRAYRSVGLIVPRNAHDQWLKCQKGEPLQLGDLVFLDEKGEGRMTHVMLYLGGEDLLEASMTAGRVQTITFSKKTGGGLEEHSLKGSLFPW